MGGERGPEILQPSSPGAQTGVDPVTAELVDEVDGGQRLGGQAQ
jgi:hypothetical protein